MSSFTATQGQFSQQHFTVVELDLPVVSGACTVSGLPGYGTSLSCDQASNAIQTHYFTDTDAPILPQSGIYRCIKGLSETVTRLQSGKGLGSRGSVSITFIDFQGDPNPTAPAVTDEVKLQGTFFGKLDSRNVIVNRDLRIKNYRIESDGSIDLVNGAETRYYLTESLTSDGKTWQLKCKDELSRLNKGEATWPIPLEGSIRTAVNSTTTTIPVDANVTYVIGDTIRVGDEFMKVSSVSGIGTGSASLTVGARGSSIVYTNTLTRTVADSHAAGDEVFVCEVSDDERLDDLLKRILVDIGVPVARIPFADWTAEVDEWHSATRVNTLWSESLSAGEILEQILTNFMLDMWFDPVTREVKLSAISAWKQSTAQLTEGNEIDFESIKKKPNEGLRATRALVIYDKPFLAESDDVSKYRKASLFKRTSFEADDLYGEPKTKLFDNTPLLVKASADLLVNRWVNRYSSPSDFTWTAQERKLNYSVGDVVDISSSVTVGFDGLAASAIRGQVIEIKPVYTKFGREYSVSALSYEPVFNATGTEIVITGNVSDIDLYNQYAGAPPGVVTITFVFDAAISSSSASNIISIRAGGFAAGSKIIMILANGADLQAKGGNGGHGENLLWDDESSTWGHFALGNGLNGAVVYDAEGIDTDIYFSGATPSAAYPVADGKIRAPSGGGGGFVGSFTPGSPLGAVGGKGGDGGSGRDVGAGGAGGLINGTSGTTGTVGTNGTSTANFGLVGANNNAVGGAAGSGVKDSGATVVFFGSSAARYINGNGDH